MNYGAKVNEAKYLCQKGRRTYADAETRERQEEGIRDMEQGINTYKMILSAGAPDYLRKNIQDLITNEEPMLAKMKENLGKIAAKVKPVQRTLAQKLKFPIKNNLQNYNNSRFNTKRRRWLLKPLIEIGESL